MTGIDLGLAKAKVSFDLVGEVQVAIRVAAAQAFRYISKAVDVLFAGGLRHQRNRFWRVAFQVRAELAYQNIAEQLLTRLGDRGVVGDRETETGLDELEELCDCIFFDDRLVLVFFCQPPCNERFALTAVENRAKDRGRRAILRLVKERKRCRRSRPSLAEAFRRSARR